MLSWSRTRRERRPVTRMPTPASLHTRPPPLGQRAPPTLPSGLATMSSVVERRTRGWPCSLLVPRPGLSAPDVPGRPLTLPLTSPSAQRPSSGQNGEAGPPRLCASVPQACSQQGRAGGSPRCSLPSMILPLSKEQVGNNSLPNDGCVPVLRGQWLSD